MPSPIVFISHFAIKPGKLDGFRALAREVTERLESEKPRTSLFLVYLDEANTTVSFVHAFADAEALELHFEGADKRSQAAFEFIEPRGWEFYGDPGEAILAQMGEAARSAGVPLVVKPVGLGGFLRR